jgi:hypothetical protein
MSILQSTFDKHKKLVLENLGVLDETELYHATPKENIPSFADGIDISKAGKLHGGAGEQQGKGFYVFRNKKAAINHAKTMDNDAIVIIDRDINSDNFDVDYELEYNYLSKFIEKNWDFFSKNWDKLHIYTHGGEQIAPPRMKGVFKIGFDGEWTSTINGNFDTQDGTSVRDAKLFWKMVQEWKKINPSLFQQFEDETLIKANVLKYNGKEKIYPVRIEDLQGNILWKADK